MSDLMIFNQRGRFLGHRILTEFSVSAKLEKGSFFSMFRIRIRKQDSAELFMINESSVPDPWHFGVDPDPDPRIHASD
jgi:hypothetical protein